MNFRLVLHRQRGDVGVGDQVSPRSGGSKVLLQERKVLQARIKRCNVALTQPIPHIAHGLRR